jgi:hypothetical protein
MSASGQPFAAQPSGRWRACYWFRRLRGGTYSLVSLMCYVCSGGDARITFSLRRLRRLVIRMELGAGHGSESGFCGREKDVN